MRTKKLQATAWIIFYLVAIDVSINLLLPYPEDPSVTNISSLRRYFEYGRSIEGKLGRMTGPTDNQSAPIVPAGWLSSTRYRELPSKSSGFPEVLVAVYGMSHMHLLGKAISEYNENYVIRDITAPGAPANWSLAAYQLDKEHHSADVAILGIMADGIPFVTTTSGTTMFFDMSYPYTYPRYVLKDNTLCPIFPPFLNVNGYRDFFYNNSKWAEYRQWLYINDKYYDPLLFRKTVLDHSCLFRLIRRAYAETVRKSQTNKVYTDNGFTESSEEAIVLKMIVTEFALSARQKNSVPIIFLVNNPGRGSHLFALLKPTLDTENIPYLSTHVICPPDNPLLFLPENTHFIPEKDRELAQAMINIIEKELKQRRNCPSFLSLDSVHPKRSTH